MTVSGAPRPLSWRVEHREEVLRSADEAFPLEACGVLLGRAGTTSEGPLAQVDEVVVCSNVADEPERRYEIAPRELFDVHLRARGSGLEVVGYWHSHPDGTDEPSETDRAGAFPGVSFVVVAAGPGGAGRARSFRLDPATRRFHEQTLEIRPSPAATPGAI